MFAKGDIVDFLPFFTCVSNLSSTKSQLTSSDSTSSHEQSFLSDVLTGLGDSQRHFNCKYFYDLRGSQLFDAICETDDYYVTRTELAIMDQYLEEMVEQIGRQVMLLEYGSGSSTKTRKLLAKLEQPAAYVPIDISEEHLLQAANTLRELFPDIEVLPVTADFTSEFELPRSQKEATHAAVYFPGSTIGNFPPAEAKQMLARFAKIVGSDGGLLIGFDRQKDPKTLEAAYNDSQGVTAAFNLNLLHRINRELGADFDVDAFEHRAVYFPNEGRIEMQLVSKCAQTVNVGGKAFEFSSGEHIRTEYSHKYKIEDFTALAAEAGFSLRKHWSDPKQYFAVMYFVQNAD